MREGKVKERKVYKERDMEEVKNQGGGRGVLHFIVNMCFEVFNYTSGLYLYLAPACSLQQTSTDILFTFHISNKYVQG